MENNQMKVIGIDHGWANMKTVHFVFTSGVREIPTEPAFYDDVLEYQGKYYKIGGERLEVKENKVVDENYYLLTLAAIAKELNYSGIRTADIFLAVGLPLTKFGKEKADFIKYLSKNRQVIFRYEKEKYCINIVKVAVFPQCYAAVADNMPKSSRKQIVVDIGSWTIDIMPIVNCKPDESLCDTIEEGLIRCITSIVLGNLLLLNSERGEASDRGMRMMKLQITDMLQREHSMRTIGVLQRTSNVLSVRL